MSRLKLIIIGLVVPAIGLGYHLINQLNSRSAPAAWLVGLLALTGWILVGYLSGRLADSPARTTLWAQLPQLVALLLSVASVALPQMFRPGLNGWLKSLNLAPQILTDYVSLTPASYLVTAAAGLFVMTAGYFWGAVSRQRFQADSQNNKRRPR